MKIIRKDTFSDTSALVYPWTHYFSDESIDAYDDVIRQAGWEFGPFENNPVVLLAHNSQQPPIGHVPKMQVRDRKLYGRIELAPKGTSERIDEIRALMGLDGGTCVLKGVSVGFYPLESRPRAGSTKGGVEFLRQRLTEVSVCSIPANSNALAIARSLGISRSTMAQVFTDGSTVSEHITAAREAVAEGQRATMIEKLRTTNRSIANLQRKLAGNVISERERTIQTKTLGLLQRAAAELSAELSGADAAEINRRGREAARTAQAVRVKQIVDRAIDQQIADYENNPWNGPQIEHEAYVRRATERAHMLEADYLRKMQRQGRPVPETFVPSPPGTVTWRNQVISLTPLWRGKPVK